MTVDYSKYAEIANKTKTVEINGQKTQVITKTADESAWKNIAAMHNAVNNGDTYFCTDGVDDGQITSGEKAGLFVDGMVDSAKDKAVPVAVGVGVAVGVKAIAGTAVGTAVTGAIGGTAIGAACLAAAPVVLGVAAVVGGLFLVAKGVSSFVNASKEAKNATTDSEAKAAWSQMGSSTTDTAVGAATAYFGAKSLKTSIPKAQQNPTLQQAGAKVKQAGAKVKGKLTRTPKAPKANTTTTPNTNNNGVSLWSRIKDFFSRTKTNTAEGTNSQALSTNVQPNATNGSAQTAEILTQNELKLYDMLDEFGSKMPDNGYQQVEIDGFLKAFFEEAKNLGISTSEAQSIAYSYVA